MFTVKVSILRRLFTAFSAGRPLPDEILPAVSVLHHVWTDFDGQYAYVMMCFRARYLFGVAMRLLLIYRVKSPKKPFCGRE